tara:strand:+ start:902 stop:1738 length:837 start_codon:yes stop_codon:yes gene_type:complete
MSKEEKMRSAFSNLLYIKEGVRIAPKDLRSTKADKIVSDDQLKLILKYEEYFKQVEDIVTFIDDIRNPTGIYKFMRGYAETHGTKKYKTVKIHGVDTELFDYYEPNNPEEYVMCIVDHVSLLSTETLEGKRLNLRDCISKLSSDYFVKLRNMYNYIPVAIQQQASAQESVENAKANRLKPTMDGLGDNKSTQRDANVILGLFSPYRHEIPDYKGYDIKYFKDNIRFLEILGGREGGGGTICPLYFDGAVNYFKELPKPKDTTGLNGVTKFINKIRGNE